MVNLWNLWFDIRDHDKTIKSISKQIKKLNNQISKVVSKEKNNLFFKKQAKKRWCNAVDQARFSQLSEENSSGDARIF
jgi:hypothetical protein